MKFYTPIFYLISQHVYSFKKKISLSIVLCDQYGIPLSKYFKYLFHNSP